MMSGHGVEVSGWLATSMSNGTAIKLWNLNLVPRAMSSNLGCGRGRALTRNIPSFWFVRFVWRYF